MQTTAHRDNKSQAVLIYDGECRFCQFGQKRLRRYVGWRLRTVPLQQPDVQSLHPDLKPEAMRAQMHLVVGDKLYGGAEAVAQSIALRPVGKIAFLYYLPVLRPLLDAAYRWIATHRYQIFGRTVGGCEGGACQLPHTKK